MFFRGVCWPASACTTEEHSSTTSHSQGTAQALTWCSRNTEYIIPRIPTQGWFAPHNFMVDLGLGVLGNGDNRTLITGLSRTGGVHKVV